MVLSLSGVSHVPLGIGGAAASGDQGEKAQQDDQWPMISSDIMSIIFRSLEFTDLPSVALTCRRFYHVIQDDYKLARRLIANVPFSLACRMTAANANSEEWAGEHLVDVATKVGALSIRKALNLLPLMKSASDRVQLLQSLLIAHLERGLSDDPKLVKNFRQREELEDILSGIQSLCESLQAEQARLSLAFSLFPLMTDGTLKWRTDPAARILSFLNSINDGYCTFSIFLDPTTIPVITKILLLRNPDLAFNFAATHLAEDRSRWLRWGQQIAADYPERAITIFTSVYNEIKNEDPQSFKFNEIRRLVGLSVVLGRHEKNTLYMEQACEIVNLMLPHTFGSSSIFGDLNWLLAELALALVELDSDRALDIATRVADTDGDYLREEALADCLVKLAEKNPQLAFEKVSLLRADNPATNFFGFRSRVYQSIWDAAAVLPDQITLAESARTQITSPTYQIENWKRVSILARRSAEEAESLLVQIEAEGSLPVGDKIEALCEIALAYSRQGAEILVADQTRVRQEKAKQLFREIVEICQRLLATPSDNEFETPKDRATSIVEMLTEILWVGSPYLDREYVDRIMKLLFDCVDFEVVNGKVVDENNLDHETRLALLRLIAAAVTAGDPALIHSTLAQLTRIFDKINLPTVVDGIGTPSPIVHDNYSDQVKILLSLAKKLTVATTVAERSNTLM